MIVTSCIICNTDIKYRPSHFKKIKNHTCSISCMAEFRKKHYMGLDNPNRKYMYNDNFFEEIDTEEKAYILGFIASDGHIRKNGFAIAIHNKDIDILEKIKNIISSDLKITHQATKHLITLNINSTKMSLDLCKHLSIEPGKKSHSVNFPNKIANELKNHFIRGFFDGDGHISLITETHGSPRAGIATNSKLMRDGICKIIKAKYWTDNIEKLEWSGNNALDFLNQIYSNCEIKMNRKYRIYEDIATWAPASSYSRHWKNNIFSWSKTRKDAISPSKERASDSGYDLTLLEKVKTIGDVEFYDTGVKIKPHFGIYMLLAPRSSISKTGYQFANSVGIIDRTFMGNILIPLRKINKDAEDLKLPIKLAQLIPQPIIHVDLIEVEEFDEISDRADNGFGSTGV